jgi:hypothetical protein
MPPIGIGGIIALVVLVLAVVLIVVGQLPLVVGGLIAGLAVARLV